MKNKQECFYVIALDKAQSSFCYEPSINKFGSVGTIMSASKWFEDNSYLRNYFNFVKTICVDAEVLKVNADYNLENVK
jgi:hypothetical protein